MWCYFHRFGHVVDVFVPKKSAREGREFGFVHFREVRNVENLVMEVCGVKVGANTLSINVLRF